MYQSQRDRSMERYQRSISVVLSRSVCRARTQIDLSEIDLHLHFSWKNDRSERYAQIDLSEIDLRSVHGKPVNTLGQGFRQHVINYTFDMFYTVLLSVFLISTGQ